MKKPLTALLLVTSAFLLTACGGSTRLDKAGIRVQPDSKLTEKCSLPSKLPERNLTQVDVERLWSKDRAALIRCGVTKEALIKFLKARDKQ